MADAFQPNSFQTSTSSATEAFQSGGTSPPPPPPSVGARFQMPVSPQIMIFTGGRAA